MVREYEDDDVVAVCTECHSDQKDQYINNSPFGDQAPCQYCGGVITVTRKQDRDRNLKRIDGQRGAK